MCSNQLYLGKVRPIVIVLQENCNTIIFAENFTLMKNWNELSITDKNDIIRVAVQNGITALPDIRERYNEFAEGGDIVAPVDENVYAEGGSIHIKPSHRGKFTALKKRTGHSASWFKAHGTPAQRKMATFELNARKWKHGDGGNLFFDGGTQASDNTRVQLGIVPNLPMDDSAESKFYRDLALLSAMTDEEKKAEEFYNRAHDTGTVASTDVQAREGWMEVNPISGEAEWHTPTTVSAAPLTEGQRMWQSPAFQLALAPMFDAPFILANAARTKQAYKILGDAVENSNALKSNISDLNRRYAALQKVYGINPENPTAFSTDVTKGLSNEAKSHLAHNTVERNARELLKAGAKSENMPKYTSFAENLMNDVNVGRYTQKDYSDAGMDFVGFFNPDRNFISVNMESSYSPFAIETHEGRHLLDKHMPLLNSQKDVLFKAYGREFLKVPETEFAGPGVKGYKHIADDIVTTNLNARDALLGENAKLPLSEQDLLIDAATDEEIFNAVKASNGYGKGFIEYLSHLGKLTPQKAQALRDAMKYVGSYTLPIGGIGVTGYSYLNQDEGPLVEMAMGGRLSGK